jgi:hypothetical protein
VDMDGLDLGIHANIVKTRELFKNSQIIFWTLWTFLQTSQICFQLFEHFFNLADFFRKTRERFKSMEDFQFMNVFPNSGTFYKNL